MKGFLVFIFLVFNFNLLFSQNNNADSLCWDEQLRLEWSDFKGKPDTTVITYLGVKATAQTFAYVTAKGYWRDGLPDFRVFNRFIRSLSWTIDTTKGHEIIHEQLHFDIAELYARKMRSGISEFRKKKISEINVYTEFINKTLVDLHERNIQYDIQTGHGVVPLRQKEWEMKIKDELSKLREFRSTVEMCN